MTLELNHIKNYFGTELKVHVDEYGFELVIGFQGDELITTEDNATIDICKPLLLPLSALTEPLPDGSIPIVELAKIASTDWVYDEFYIEGEYIIAQCGESHRFIFDGESHRFIFDGESFWFQNGYGNAEIAKHQLKLFEYLYQHHFWLGDQSLFETGDIIDKRTLKPQP